MTICIKKREKSTRGKLFNNPSSAAAYMLGRRFDHYDIWKIVDGKKIMVPFVSADIFTFEEQLKSI